MPLIHPFAPKYYWAAMAVCPPVSIQWFGTKTPSETIDRIVREAMKQLGMERDDEPEEVVTTTSDGAMQFYSAPGLAFTKPLAASINGKALH